MPTLRERLADSSVVLLAHKSTESKRNLEIPIHSHARAFYFLNSHVRTRIGFGGIGAKRSPATPPRRSSSGLQVKTANRCTQRDRNPAFPEFTGPQLALTLSSCFAGIG